MDILSILDSKNIEYVLKGGNEVSITCPNAVNHEGAVDSAPSFNINLDSVHGHCFVCNLSMNTASMTRFLLGEDLDELSYKCLELRGKLKKLQEVELKLDLPLSVTSDIIFPPGKPLDEPYRGISVETYRKLRAILCDRGRYEGRLCFPIILDGKLIGVDGRLLDDSKITSENPKYKRNYNTSCKHNWLWPYDIVKAMIKEQGLTYVIIAEGSFHSAKAINFGFPCLTYFGANNFSENKALMLLALGVREVVIFPDKDKAGEQVVYGNPEAKTEILQMGIGRYLSNWINVSVACTDNLKIDPLASLKKQKLVYQDLADLDKNDIQYSLDHRREFK